MNLKTCNNNHKLTYGPGSARSFPTCNGCGAKSIEVSHFCWDCNFDLCQKCFTGPYGNSGNLNTGSNMISQVQPLLVGNHKLCKSGHTLTYTTGQQRFFPTCNSCNATKLQFAYSCYTCNYDLCASCYTNPYGGSTTSNTGYVPNTGFNTNTNINTGYVPNTGYNTSSNINTGYIPNTGLNTNINTGYVPNTGFSTNTNYNNTGYVPNTGLNTNTNTITYPSINTNTNYNQIGYVPNTGFNSNINTGYIPNTGLNSNINTGFIPNTGLNTNINTGYVPNTNNIYVPNTGFNSNTNYNVNTNTTGNSYNMTSQIKAIEYKQCPSFHYLTLCDPSTRSYPTCNICGTSGLKYSWTCFTCNYDMCLSCYDKDNTRPTNKVKVCNKRHLLYHTDCYKRPNVKCDKCYKTGFLNQYTCWVCNYDECQSCYDGRTANNCVIF